MQRQAGQASHKSAQINNNTICFCTVGFFQRGPLVFYFGRWLRALGTKGPTAGVSTISGQPASPVVIQLLQGMQLPLRRKKRSSLWRKSLPCFLYSTRQMAKSVKFDLLSPKNMWDDFGCGQTSSSHTLLCAVVLQDKQSRDFFFIFFFTVDVIH